VVPRAQISRNITNINCLYKLNFFVISTIVLLVLVALVGCASDSTSDTGNEENVSSNSPPLETPTPASLSNEQQISASSTTQTEEANWCEQARQPKRIKLCGYVASGGYSVVAQDGEYLGQLVGTGVRSSYTSVCDMPRKQSMKPNSPPYGKTVGDYSAYSRYAEYPPLIVNSSGGKVGYITKRSSRVEIGFNNYHPDDVLDAAGC
jgi:hypothetical protein